MSFGTRFDFTHGWIQTAATANACGDATDTGVSSRSGGAAHVDVLPPEHAHLRVKAEDWMKLKQAQKEKLVKKMRTMPNARTVSASQPSNFQHETYTLKQTLTNFNIYPIT